jgi:tetratricopeptide (TPR) repeat protein
VSGLPAKLGAAVPLAKDWSGDDDASDRLLRLFATVAALCDEAGITCLAERFASSNDACTAETCTCGAFGQRRTVAHLLPKLAPTTRALIQLGYYDLALATVKMALSLEPTLDLDLARAYLHVVLGDTEEACQIYQHVLKRLGQIPPQELVRLKALAQEHASEEDIGELVTQLQHYTATSR